MSEIALLSQRMQPMMQALIAFPVIGFPLVILPWISRRWDTDADMYASRPMSPDGMTSALVKLAGNSFTCGIISKRVEFLLFHPVLESRVERVSSGNRSKDTAFIRV